MCRRSNKERRNTDHFLIITFSLLTSWRNTQSWSKCYCGWRSTREGEAWLYSYSRMLFNFSNEIMTARTMRENLIRDLRLLINNREGGLYVLGSDYILRRLR